MQHSIIKQIAIMLSIGICISCNAVNKQLVRVDLNSSTEQVELKLSEILDDIKIVKLETNDSALIGSRAKAAITDKYIIIIEPTKVLQFSKEGKFIKTLAVRGNGPKEFNTIVNPIVIPGDETLYYVDFKDIHSIGRIDLESGEMLTPIKFDISKFTIFTSDSEGYIYGIPNSGMKLIPDSSDITNISAFKYNPKTNDLITYPAAKSYSDSMFGNVMIGNCTKTCFINSSYSDTLFSLSNTNNSITPECLINLECKIDETTNIGSELRFIISSLNGIVFQKTDSEIKDKQRKFLKSEYMLLNKQYQAQKIKSVTISPFTYTVDMDDIKIYPIPATSGNYGYLLIDAIEYKLLDPESNVSENDNYFVIWGVIK